MGTWSKIALGLLMMSFLPIKGLLAQGGSFSSGLVPQLSVSHKISDEFSVNVKAESWNALLHIPRGEDADWDYDYQGTDFQFFATWAFHPLWKVAAGYQLNAGPEGDIQHLSIQQVSFLQRLERIRLGHRFRTDQTYERNEMERYRLRYRLSAEIPIRGLSLDPGEPYFLVSDEVLLRIRDKETSTENRLGVYWGYYMTNKDKIQFGVDYRIAPVFSGDARNHFWLRASWYVRI